MIRIRPERLKAGDTLAVVAPSGPVTDRARWTEALAFLEGCGFRAKVYPSVLGEPHGYLAASDEQRLADLHAAFGDPDIAGILCAKGGYGALRLLPRLDFDLITRHPKVLVGFSDITTLLLAIHGRCALTTFHGPMPLFNFARHAAREANTQSLWDTVGALGAWPRTLAGGEALVPGRAEGWLAGGNLATLVHLVGTPWMPDLRGALLFFEDVDEEPYRLDRYLTQLRLSGALEGVAGILAGDFTRCLPTADDKPSFTVREVLLDRLGDLGVPLLSGFPLGHDLALPTFPIGGRAILDADRGEITLVEPGVA